MARRSTALALLALSSLAACVDAPASPDGSLAPGALRMAKADDGIPEVATAKTNKVEPAGVDRGRYNITFRYIVSTTPERQAVFEAAASRWEKIIIADEPSVTGTLPTQLCGAGAPAFTGTVDDVLIDVILAPIDGPGKILGSAGPCFANDNNLTLHGTMRFDVADLATLETRGTFDEVITHEMGHVLGVGTLWNFRRALRTGTNTLNVAFVGEKAITGYNSVGGAKIPVPVENMFGPGTQNSHWREATFDNELMTGFIRIGQYTPLSRVTAGSMRDLGYGSANVAESYKLPEASQIQGSANSSNGANLAEGDIDMAASEELTSVQATVQRADP
jgi:hypothetical protein